VEIRDNFLHETKHYEGPSTSPFNDRTERGSVTYLE